MIRNTNIFAFCNGSSRAEVSRLDFVFYKYSFVWKSEKWTSRMCKSDVRRPMVLAPPIKTAYEYTEFLGILDGIPHAIFMLSSRVSKQIIEICIFLSTCAEGYTHDIKIVQNYI